MPNSKDGSGQPSWSSARLHGGNWAARGLYAKQQGRIWAAELVFCEEVGSPGAMLGKLDLPEPCTCTAVSPDHRLSRCGSPTGSWAGVRMVRLGERRRTRAVRPRVGRGTSEVVQSGPARRHTSACRAQPHLLPAGGLLHLLPAGGLLHLLPAGGLLHLLPAGGLLHLLPAGGLLHLLPAGGLLHLLPAGVVPPTTTTASLSRSACQTGRYAQPSPPDVRTPAKWHLLLGQKNPPLTHGDPAEARPPGQSQPSRVHPVKQRAGAMRTRTGAHTSSTSCASPVAWICAYLPTGSGGGRHPKPARQAPRLAVLPGRNRRNGEPPPLYAFRHYLSCPPALLPTGSTASQAPDAHGLGIAGFDRLDTRSDPHGHGLIPSPGAGASVQVALFTAPTSLLANAPAPVGRLPADRGSR
jgi:hypothetical protein